jgi:hypothetical protein
MSVRCLRLVTSRLPTVGSGHKTQVTGGGLLDRSAVKAHRTMTDCLPIAQKVVVVR